MHTWWEVLHRAELKTFSVSSVVYFWTAVNWKTHWQQLWFTFLWLYKYALVTHVSSLWNLTYSNQNTCVHAYQTHFTQGQVFTVKTWFYGNPVPHDSAHSAFTNAVASCWPRPMWWCPRAALWSLREKPLTPVLELWQRAYDKSWRPICENCLFFFWWNFRFDEIMIFIYCECACTLIWFWCPYQCAHVFVTLWGDCYPIVCLFKWAQWHNSNGLRSERAWDVWVWKERFAQAGTTITAMTTARRRCTKNKCKIVNDKKTVHRKLVCCVCDRVLVNFARMCA